MKNHQPGFQFVSGCSIIDGPDGMSTKKMRINIWILNDFCVFHDDDLVFNYEQVRIDLIFFAS